MKPLTYLPVVTISIFLVLLIKCSSGGGESSGGESNNTIHLVYEFVKKHAELRCSDLSISSLPPGLRNDSRQAVQWYKISPTRTNLHDLCQSGQQEGQLSSVTNSNEDNKAIKEKDDKDEENSHSSAKKKEKEDEEEESNKKGVNCELVYTLVKNQNSSNNPMFYSTLRIIHVRKADYGDYECQVGGKVLRRFSLRGDVRVTRKYVEDRKTEHSVIPREGETMKLYCNYSMYEGDKYVKLGEIPDVQLQWFFADVNGTEIDISQDLEHGLGLFQNFTKIQGTLGEYKGPALEEHRGKYTCSLKLINPKQGGTTTVLVEDTKRFPANFTFHVRVRDYHAWAYPGGILLVEVLGIIIFTALIWNRDENQETVEDSEDEDDEPSSSSPKENGSSSKKS